MKFFSIILGFLVISILLFSNQSFAIDFRDSTGYTPSWALGKGYHSVLLECTEISSTTSRDGNWCMEWVAYVLDQGIENFPQSTQENSKSAPDLTLEAGPVYSGPLEKLLLDEFTFGEDWLVGRPFTGEEFDQGVTDMVSQRIVVPDQFDNSKFLLISVAIIQFDNENISKGLYERAIKTIDERKLPTIGEKLELEEKGITVNGIRIDKTSEYFPAECVGIVKNLYKSNEEAALTCLKDDFIIISMAKWNNEDIYNDYLWDSTPEGSSEDTAEIIINKINNVYHSNPEIKIPSNTKLMAFQYSKEKITDTQMLEFLQKQINDGSLKFPTNEIVIEKNSQRLSYIPDLPRITINNWGRGLTDDQGFASTLGWLVEKGYITIPGFDSSSITVSSEKKEAFLDMDDNNGPKVTNSIPKNQEINESTSDSDVPAWAMGLAAFVVFGIPIIVIALIIWKIKRGKVKKQKIKDSKWKGV